MSKSSVVSFLILFSFAIAAIASDESRQSLNLLIKDAQIVDGSGSPGYRGDVRVHNGSIIAVGQLRAQDNDEVLNAKGLTLAPGFIDTHSHHDHGLDESPQAIAAISQGITTIVIGQDGTSRLPLEDFVRNFEANPAAVNVASYTGHGALRLAVMGADYKRKATSDEIHQMQQLVESDMKNGSLGISTGLEYDPGIYSNKDEIIELAKTVATQGGRYISHMRSEDRELYKAIDELINIGKQAQLPVQISHIKLAAVDLWGQADQVIQRLDDARANGVNVSADIYPYTYWESTLTVLLPQRNFNDLEEAKYALEHLAPASGLTLTYYAPNPSFVGKTVAEIAGIRNETNEEAYLHLIRDAYEGIPTEELGNLSEPRESVMGVSMTEEDISKLVAWSNTNICSDGSSEGHPRGHGSFPRAFRQYVREQGILSIEEMVRKMTSLSASHMGLANKGLIKEGFAADLVLFNPDTITDKATMKNPSLLSEGIQGVWVNGERVWQSHSPTGKLPGKFVARGI